MSNLGLFVFNDCLTYILIGGLGVSNLVLFAKLRALKEYNEGDRKERWRAIRGER